MFEPHGNARIEVRGRFLVVQPQGDLNDEEVLRILQHINNLIPGFEGRPWAVLYLLQTSTLLTPEAQDTATLATPQLTASGLSALAIVHPPDISGRLQESQVRHIYSNTRCPVRLFDNEADAVAWASGIIVQGLPGP